MVQTRCTAYSERLLCYIRLKHIKYCKSRLVISAVMVNTHLRSSRRPLSPRWDRAGLSWMRAWRFACEPEQHTKSDKKEGGHTTLLSNKHHQLNLWVFQLGMHNNICTSSVSAYKGFKMIMSTSAKNEHFCWIWQALKMTLQSWDFN